MVGVEEKSRRCRRNDIEGTFVGEERAGRREEEEERERREREFDRDVSWFVKRAVVVVEEGVSVVVVGRRRIVVNALLTALATETLDIDLTE